MRYSSIFWQAFTKQMSANFDAFNENYLKGLGWGFGFVSGVALFVVLYKVIH
jgi:hypothetical protein